MHRLLERQFEVPLGIDDAWRFLARVEDWPHWAHHIRRIDLTPTGEAGPRTTGVIRLRGGIRSTFVMREFVPGEHWLWSGPFAWLTVHYDHRFAALAPDRTRLTWTLDAEGFGASILGPLFARIYARNLDRAIPRLIAAMGEANPASGSA